MVDLHADPLEKIRVVKRWALVSVLAVALGLLPAYGVLLGIPFLLLVLVLSPVTLSAVLAIELASRWEYRVHRRYAYPYRLGYELASIHQFEEACQRSADLIGRWLGATSVVVAWIDEEGDALAPVASYGLPGGWTVSAPNISLDDPTLAETLSNTRALIRSSARGDPWFGDRFQGHRLVYVPLATRDRPEGVLTAAFQSSNAAARDQRLFAALGMVLGLALDNCRLYEEQRRHAHHLQQINQMKSDFLMTVSHELRTPLTSITLAVEMLIEEEPDGSDGPQARLLRNILKSASRLNSLVADVLRISREDKVDTHLDISSVPLGDLVANAAAIIHPLLIAKRQSLEIRLESADFRVSLDRLRFEQVLTNLLSNAQRYTPDAGRLAVTSCTEGGEVIISVHDSGPGVAPKDRELIFEPFYRGDRSGLGLGLAIAKSLVELHRGRIWVESTDRGSTFNVALPLARSPVARPVAAGAASR
jgi:signal transduction histidine kinase